ncbi:class I SAM-dependent methyltransferase, partial [Mycobacterium sp.]|uniref:class I SAM-dependent methyltransferase n=1 Tax=Mycobacterium sp. TaxID=1785 RepID=UPI003C722D1D
MGHSEPDAYRRMARWYDSIFGRLNAGLRGLGLKMLPPREGMDVLDVGCGTGIQLAAYQEAGCRVSGIDTSQAMLNVAHRRLRERADLRLGDAARMPYPDGAFDLVLAATVLHEMPPEVRGTVLDEMRRVLRPDERVPGQVLRHGKQALMTSSSGLRRELPLPESVRMRNRSARGHPQINREVTDVRLLAHHNLAQLGERFVQRLHRI